MRAGQQTLSSILEPDLSQGEDLRDLEYVAGPKIRIALQAVGRYDAVSP